VFLAGLASWLRSLYTPNLICSNKAGNVSARAAEKSGGGESRPDFFSTTRFCPIAINGNLITIYYKSIHRPSRSAIGAYLKAFYFIHLGEHLKLMKRLAEPLAIGAHQTQ
jgi:hypothetical protein